MRTTGNHAPLAGALLLAFGSIATLAGGARPFEVDFDKCFAHYGPAPYLFTFSGPGSGDAEFGSDTRADGTSCAAGTFYITPRWNLTHGDENDD